MCFLENVRIFKGKPHMILLKKLVITKYQKIINCVYVLCFSAKNELQMITNWVSRFGGDESGDTRCGLVDEVAPFFGKIIIFVHQIITFCNIIFEK